MDKLGKVFKMNDPWCRSQRVAALSVDVQYSSPIARI